MDKRGGTALRDLRDSLKGKKLSDGKPVGRKKHRLTDNNIKKLQRNCGKAIRSNVAPKVTTANEHKNAVDKMQKAVMASLYNNVMLPDDKVRHQYCPKGKEYWCKYQRGGKLRNQPHHLDSVFLSLLEPIYTKRLGSYELLLG